MTVVHATSVWLPRTQTWMYNQLRFLPEYVDTRVVCEKTANLDSFGLSNIDCLADQPLPRRWVDRGLRKLGIRRHLAFLTDTARSIQADVIHSHFGLTAWHNMEAARRAEARHVVSVYGADITQAPRSNPRIRRRYRDLFHHIDAVFCEGGAMAQQVIELGCPPDRAVVHHLGVNLDLLPFRPRVWTPGSPLRVLIAATFREKKGIPYAIRALATIRDRVELEITIIGDATSKPGDQEEKARILAAIDNSGLRERTRLTGFRSHDALIEEAYDHHIFLSPSVTAGDGDSEGGAPVSIIEMAASGMPIVSSRHCDIPEIIVDGVTGWLAPERDVDRLAEHLHWLIANPDAWLSFLEKGRRHIEEEYNCRIQGQRLAEQYLRIIKLD